MSKIGNRSIIIELIILSSDIYVNDRSCIFVCIWGWGLRGKLPDECDCTRKRAT